MEIKVSVNSSKHFSIPLSLYTTRLAASLSLFRSPPTNRLSKGMIYRPLVSPCASFIPAFSLFVLFLTIHLALFFTLSRAESGPRARPGARDPRCRHHRRCYTAAAAFARDIYTCTFTFIFSSQPCKFTVRRKRSVFSCFRIILSSYIFFFLHTRFRFSSFEVGVSFFPFFFFFFFIILPSNCIKYSHIQGMYLQARASACLGIFIFSLLHAHSLLSASLSLPPCRLAFPFSKARSLTHSFSPSL